MEEKSDKQPIESSRVEKKARFVCCNRFREANVGFKGTRSKYMKYEIPKITCGRGVMRKGLFMYGCYVCLKCAEISAVLASRWLTCCKRDKVKPLQEVDYNIGWFISLFSFYQLLYKFNVASQTNISN